MVIPREESSLDSQRLCRFSMLGSNTSQKQDSTVLHHWHSGLVHLKSNIQILIQSSKLLPHLGTMLWWANI